ncbi:MAG: sigma-70 family RNA polymerase sigma factor [Hyphomicrobiales bacterium]|nr:sigma-70 family RNA polymerase sigma factor [Hyphomicrobiales bacterium]
MRNETILAAPLPATRCVRTLSTGEADATIIRAIGTGDRQAMRTLYGRYQTRVFRFILRIVRDEALAEDLTSEVFISVWRHASRFEGRASVTTWLLAIARNRAIAAIRRQRDVALDEDVEIESGDDPEVTLQGKHRGEILRKCLTQLSREHREIIDLVYYHERSVQEVAEIVGIPRNTVKTRMFYARRRLSELLEAQGVVGAMA